MARPSPVRSPKYLAFVRRQRCWFCMTDRDIQAHHHGRKQGGGGVGLKGCDLFTVPLCPSHHQEWHQKGSIGALSHVETQLEMWRAIGATLRARAIQDERVEMAEEEREVEP